MTSPTSAATASTTSESTSSDSLVSTDKTQTQTSEDLIVKISYGNNPITRGLDQTIWIGVEDSSGPISGASVSITVLYASEQTTQNFTETTDNGSCEVGWLIGGNSTPGVFQVTVTVEGIAFHSSFEVDAAS